MLNNKTIKQVTGAALALLICGGAHSAAPTPTGLIAFAPLQLQDGGGAPLGQAILTYKNQNYDVTINGLGVGGTKGIKVTVAGEVYGLSNVTDLEGDYVSELSEAPATDVSSDDLWLYSQRGVSLHLHTDNAAATIATGGDQVLVQFGSAE